MRSGKEHDEAEGAETCSEMTVRAMHEDRSTWRIAQQDTKGVKLGAKAYPNGKEMNTDGEGMKEGGNDNQGRRGEEGG